MLRWINKDKKLKISSLIFVVIIWFYIMGDLGYNVWFFGKEAGLKEKEIKAVSVQILQKAEELKGKVVLSPKTIDIIVKGKEDKIDKITSKKITAYVDVSEFGIGTYFAIVKLILPEGVKVVSDIKTATVEVAAKWNEAAPAVSKEL